jgi:hypothetical protein
VEASFRVLVYKFILTSFSEKSLFSSASGLTPGLVFRSPFRPGVARIRL